MLEALHISPPCLGRGQERSQQTPRQSPEVFLCKDTGIQWIRLLNLWDCRGTWEDWNFLFVWFCFVMYIYGIFGLFLMYSWCIRLCKFQVYITAIHKGCVPPTVTTKCWLYTPCCRTHPSSLLIPYVIVCTTQSPIPAPPFFLSHLGSH